MKSKKKLLLLGVGAMSALALGVGATSTFAWYLATASASTAYHANAVTGTLTSGATEVAALELKVRVTAAINAEEGHGVLLSSSDGISYGYVGDILYAASPAAGVGDLYDYITLSAEVLDATGSRAANSEELAKIANNTTFTFAIQGGDRTRLYAAAPAALGNIDDSAPHNKITVTGTFTASAASCQFSVNSSDLTDNKMFYSIAGQIILSSDTQSGGYYYEANPAKTVGADMTSTEITDFWTNATTAQKASHKDNSVSQSLTLTAS